MPSTTEAGALSFAPDASTLEAAIALLEREGDRSGGAVTPERRRVAFAQYEALPAPGTRPGRTWKHDYDKLKLDGFRWTSDRMRVATTPLDAFAKTQDADAEPDRPALATETAAGIVHAGATYLEPAAAMPLPDGVVVASIADGLRRAAAPRAQDGVLNGADSLSTVASIVDDLAKTDRFVALATAFQNCGAFVYVPDGVVLDAPIQLVFAASEAYDDAVFPQIAVILGAGARATVIERHLGEGDALVCEVVAAHLGAGAVLDYVAVQQAGENARVFASRAARLERDATVRWHVAELGATLARSVVDARMDAEGARAEMDALFFNTGFQHVDLTTTTDHAVGNTTSSTVVRSAATDRGQGRFFGNITIRPHAHGSDASLRDDALLLSRRSHIDSVPALEIAANDVSAFHGATVGSLDEDALFYAGSRGIARPEAVRMVALAFFEPAIARFPSDALRDEVRTALDRKIDEAAGGIDA